MTGHSTSRNDQLYGAIATINVQAPMPTFFGPAPPDAIGAKSGQCGQSAQASLGSCVANPLHPSLFQRLCLVQYFPSALQRPHLQRSGHLLRPRRFRKEHHGRHHQLAPRAGQRGGAAPGQQRHRQLHRPRPHRLGGGSHGSQRHAAPQPQLRRVWTSKRRRLQPKGQWQLGPAPDHPARLHRTRACRRSAGRCASALRASI